MAGREVLNHSCILLCLQHPTENTDCGLAMLTSHTCCGRQSKALLGWVQTQLSVLVCLPLLIHGLIHDLRGLSPLLLLPGGALKLT